MKIIIFFIVLFLCAPSFFQDKKGVKEKYYLVISLKIKNNLLYDGCTIEKSIIDSATCLNLSFDTISTNQQTNHYKNKLFIDLDSLKEPVSFSIDYFEIPYFYFGYDDLTCHKDSCLAKKDVNYFHEYNSKAKVHISEIKIKQNKDTTQINFPSVYFYLKD